MTREFITYNQALALKELGFDEECFGYWNIDPQLKTPCFNMVKPFEYEWCLPAPTFSQAFRWFREKYNLVSEIQAPDGKDGVWNPTIQKVYGFGNYYDYNNGFKTYEEAEQACLDKLIQIVKNNAHI